MPSLSRLCHFCVLFTVSAAAQNSEHTVTTIQQKADKSRCANIVAVTGNVNLNCSALTTEQSRILAQLPLILKKIVANKLDVDAINEKLDTMISQEKTPVVNSAPGGFAISGGTVFQPQITNFRPPLPDLIVNNLKYEKPYRVPSHTPQFRGDVSSPAYTVGFSATFEVAVRSVFQNPAFAFDCNTPCDAVNVQTVHGQSSNSDSSSYTLLKSADGMTAGVALKESQFYPGLTIRISIVARDADTDLVVKNIRPWAP